MALLELISEIIFSLILPPNTILFSYKHSGSRGGDSKDNQGFLCNF